MEVSDNLLTLVDAGLANNVCSNAMSNVRNRLERELLYDINWIHRRIARRERAKKRGFSKRQIKEYELREVVYESDYEDLT